MRRKGITFYTNDELLELKRAFDLACTDLRLRSGNAVLRERLGIVIFQLAATGILDSRTLRRQAVRRFRSGGAPVAGEVHPAQLSLFVTRLNDQSSGRRKN